MIVWNENLNKTIVVWFLHSYRIIKFSKWVNASPCQTWKNTDITLWDYSDPIFKLDPQVKVNIKKYEEIIKQTSNMYHFTKKTQFYKHQIYTIKGDKENQMGTLSWKSNEIYLYL